MQKINGAQQRRETAVRWRRGPLCHICSLVTRFRPSPSFLFALLALVLAVSGGALVAAGAAKRRHKTAATKALTRGQIIALIKSQLAHAHLPRGATGSQGPSDIPGSPGAPGGQGVTGAPGPGQQIVNGDVTPTSATPATLQFATAGPLTLYQSCAIGAGNPGEVAGKIYYTSTTPVEVDVAVRYGGEVGALAHGILPAASTPTLLLNQGAQSGGYTGGEEHRMTFLTPPTSTSVIDDIPQTVGGIYPANLCHFAVTNTPSS